MNWPGFHRYLKMETNSVLDGKTAVQCGVRAGGGSAVGTRQQAGSALEIRDSGPGIEEDIVQRLGEPLVKGSASTGFGLGLSIVKRLCNRFDVVLSIGPLKNGGTRAEVRFPA